MKIALFESVKAWFPTNDSNSEHTYIDLDNFMVQRPHSTIFLKVNWDSMIQEWIKDWDYVVVDKSLEIKEWNIVVALVDWEYALKYLELDARNKFYLKSANDDYPNIYPQDELQIFWTVVGSFRKYI